MRLTAADSVTAASIVCDALSAARKSSSVCVQQQSFRPVPGGTQRWVYRRLIDYARWGSGLVSVLAMRVSMGAE